jgi:hypothetical protein
VHVHDAALNVSNAQRTGVIRHVHAGNHDMLDTILLEAKAAAVANGQRPHERLHVVAQLLQVGLDHLHDLITTSTPEPS